MEETQEQNEGSIMLGGSIELTGFRDVDGGSMVILKKMIGNQVKKMNELNPQFEKLVLTKKNLHGSTKKVEVHGRAIVAGNPITREHVDFNIFFTVDKVLSGICEELKK